MSDSLRPYELYSPWNSRDQNTGVGSLSILQGIPTQGSNSALLHCRRILYQLSHKGSPRILGWATYPFCRGSSWPRNWTGISCIAGWFFTNWAIREAFTDTCGKGSHSWHLQVYGSEDGEWRLVFLRICEGRLVVFGWPFPTLTESLEMGSRVWDDKGKEVLYHRLICHRSAHVEPVLCKKVWLPHLVLHAQTRNHLQMFMLSVVLTVSFYPSTLWKVAIVSLGGDNPAVEK